MMAIGLETDMSKRTSAISVLDRLADRIAGDGGPSARDESTETDGGQVVSRGGVPRSVTDRYDPDLATLEQVYDGPDQLAVGLLGQVVHDADAGPLGAPDPLGRLVHDRSCGGGD